MARCTRKSALVFALLMATTLVFGQERATGTISGVVQDPQGTIVPGATVTARDLSTNREYTTVSDPTGFFELNSVPVGTYDVSIDAPGFQTLERHGVTVRVATSSAVRPQKNKQKGVGESQSQGVRGRSTLPELPQPTRPRLLKVKTA